MTQVEDRPFQRIGAVSNAHVGNEFEGQVAIELRRFGFPVDMNFPVDVGHGNRRKARKFDLGCKNPPLLVECKSHRWTVGDKTPSAKIAVWNESMYYFFLAPEYFKKILCVLHDINKRGESLAEYYLRNHENLIPDGVEIWEFDLSGHNITRSVDGSTMPLKEVRAC